jgi:SagB-type dehydrogenase family enzyme
LVRADSKNDEKDIRKLLKQHRGDFLYDSLSSIYHENTKRSQIGADDGVNERRQRVHMYDLAVKVINFKEYPRFNQIKLSTSFKEKHVITLGWKPTSELGVTTISLDTLSELLYYTAGIRGKGTALYRPYHSIGSRYPLELYPIILKGLDVEAGIYHYNVKRHTLELLERGGFLSQLAECIEAPEHLGNACLIILVTAVFKRSELLFGDRGYRYVLLEAGYLAQNFSITSTSLGLNCLFISEFIDDAINTLLDLDGVQESVVDVLVLGGKKAGMFNSLRGILGTRGKGE